MGVFKTHDVTFQNFKIEGSNWKGKLANFYGWAMGEKSSLAYNIYFYNYTAVNNYARGFWLDTDMRNVVVDGCNVSNNENDGMMFESNPGPINISNCYVENNHNALLEAGQGVLGMRVTNTANFNLNNMVIKNNGNSGEIEVAAGSASIPANNDYKYGTGYNITVENWTIKNSQIEDDNSQKLIQSGIWGSNTVSDYNHWLLTLTVSNNNMVSPLSQPFDGQDANAVSYSNWISQINSMGGSASP